MSRASCISDLFQPAAAPRTRRAWLERTACLPTGLHLLLFSLAAHAGPHEHGAARLELSVDGDLLLVRFSSPLDNLLGWERAPRNEQERRQYAALREELAQPAVILSIPDTAGCRLHQSTVSDPHGGSPAETQSRAASGTQPSPAREVRPDTASETHRDLEAEWSFRCGAMPALRNITLNAFDRFKRLRRVDAVFALAARTGKFRLTARQRELRFS